MTSVSFNKSDKPVQDYFRSKKVLIIHPSSAIRMTIRKTMTEFGVLNDKITQTDSFEEGIKILTDKQPEYIFTILEDRLDDTLDIIELSTKYNSNRLYGGLFLLSPDNSKSTASLMYEYEIDGIIAQPYTNKSLADAISGTVSLKIRPTPVYKLLCDAKAKILDNNYDRAYEILTDAIAIGKGASTAFCLMAKIEVIRNNRKAAFDLIEDGLKDNPSNYYCLSYGSSLLFGDKKYELAYDYAKRLIAAHPISPNKIPEIIRLAIVNRKFDDIIEFSELFKGLENVGDTVKRYIAAGLATCGRYLVSRGEMDRAKPVLREALHYSNGRPMIVENIMWSYCMGTGLIQARIIYHKICETYKIDRKRMLEFELRMIYKFAETVDEIISFGAKIIDEGVVSFSIFKIVLDALRGIGSKTTLREDIVQKAIKTFPEYKDDFRKYLN